jgi:hypothetical protein
MACTLLHNSEDTWLLDQVLGPSWPHIEQKIGSVTSNWCCMVGLVCSYVMVLQGLLWQEKTRVVQVKQLLLKFLHACGALDRTLCMPLVR